MSVKLFDSELHIMEILWRDGDTAAKRVAVIAKEKIGWSKTTTYTVISRCIEKGAIERMEPNFICRALITREQAQEYETAELINKMYGGSADRLIASLLGDRRLTAGEISRLKQLINGEE